MSITQSAPSADELRRMANENLWLHFTRMAGHEPPIIVRGDGCYLEDANGKRYLDALAGLFSVNIGYGFGDEIGRAAHEQMRELPFYTNWSYAHPRSIELAAEVAELAPGDLNRVFFVSGGSEAVESAWKLARQYHSARGERRWKAISRRLAYHGTTFGALSINGIPALRTPFEPLVPDVHHVRNGPVLRVRVDRSRDRGGARDGAVPRGDAQLHARDHLRRPSRAGGDRAQEPRDHGPRAPARARPRAGGHVPLDARAALGPADRRRPARDGLLLRTRAR